MATPKQQNIRDYLSTTVDSWEETHPLVDTKWFVSEYRPEEKDYYGYLPPEIIVVSGPLETEAEAIEWTTRFDPAPGCEFRISKKHLRSNTVTTTKWYDF